MPFIRFWIDTDIWIDIWIIFYVLCEFTKCLWVKRLFFKLIIIGNLKIIDYLLSINKNAAFRYNMQ